MDKTEWVGNFNFDFQSKVSMATAKLSHKCVQTVRSKDPQLLNQTSGSDSARFIVILI